jgi:hypothetical protein
MLFGETGSIADVVCDGADVVIVDGCSGVVGWIINFHVSCFLHHKAHVVRGVCSCAMLQWQLIIDQ